MVKHFDFVTIERSWLKLATRRSFLEIESKLPKPVKVSKNLKRLVTDSLKSQLLEPQRMVVPMARSDASVYKYPMPRHLLELNIIEAKDLVDTDSGPTQGMYQFIQCKLKYKLYFKLASTDI